MKKLIMFLLLIIACNSYGEVKTTRGTGCGMRQSMVVILKTTIKYQLEMADYLLASFRHAKNMRDETAHENHKRMLSDHFHIFKNNIGQFENVKEMQKEVLGMRTFIDKLQLEMKMAYKY